MLLSQTSAYAVRAAIHLAEHAAAGPVPVADIAEALGAPRNYLSKILHQLARSGVLVSERGQHGGFRLARPPQRTHLAEIVMAVEPKRLDRRCLLGRPECSDTEPCPVHDRWRSLADAITRFVHETTLADLQRRRPTMRSTRPRPRKAASGAG